MVGMQQYSSLMSPSADHVGQWIELNKEHNSLAQLSPLAL